MDAPVCILLVDWLSSTLNQEAAVLSVRSCTDKRLPAIQRPKSQKKNTINYHLMRLYPKIVAPHKKHK